MEIPGEICEQALVWFKMLLTMDTCQSSLGRGQGLKFIAQVLDELNVPVSEVSFEGVAGVLVGGETSASSAPLLSVNHISTGDAPTPEGWRCGPFSAQESDGCIWGVGSLQGKHKVAFDLALINLLRARSPKIQHKFLFLEENFSDTWPENIFGELVAAQGTAYAIVDGGGQSTKVLEFNSAPIILGEKSRAVLRLVANGLPADPSYPVPGNPIYLLSRILGAIESSFLGFQASEISSEFVAAHLPVMNEESGELLRKLLVPNTFEDALAELTGTEEELALKGLFCHSIAPLRLGGGIWPDRTPEHAWVDLDVRLIPGKTVEAFCSDIQLLLEQLIGADVSNIQIDPMSVRSGYLTSCADPVYCQIRDAFVKHLQPMAEQMLTYPSIALQPSYAALLASSGVKPIGFAPLIFPPDFSATSIRGQANERVPVQAFVDGLRAYLAALAR